MKYRSKKRLDVQNACMTRLHGQCWVQLIKNKLKGVFLCPCKFLELLYFKIQQKIFFDPRYSKCPIFTTENR